MQKTQSEFSKYNDHGGGWILLLIIARCNHTTNPCIAPGPTSNQ